VTALQYISPHRPTQKEKAANRRPSQYTFDELNTSGEKRWARRQYNRRVIKALCVFCGSNPGRRSAYTAAARTVGEQLAQRRITLVYGGGKVGLMGVLADACLEAGGKVVGVIPEALAAKEIAHAGLSEMYVVSSMHERKALMADRADAFLALPGGFGTWDEFCEVFTWSQLGILRKACALLNVEGYYDAFLTLADRACEDGFILPQHREMLLSDDDPARILGRIQEYEPPVLDNWAGRAQR
jgi:uncharacterized protein (TIGR00730 family)